MLPEALAEHLREQGHPSQRRFGGLLCLHDSLFGIRCRMKGSDYPA